MFGNQRTDDLHHRLHQWSDWSGFKDMHHHAPAGSAIHHDLQLMKHHQVIQYSPEWWVVRSGIPTASEFHRIVTPKGDPSKQAKPYMCKLIAERLLHIKPGSVKDYWVERGHSLEDEAADRFQQEFGYVLDTMGFVTTDDGRLGCSPDRVIVGTVLELVEIKCPAPWTHIGYLLDGPGADYKQQVQGQLLISGADCVHFFSYHPNMPSARTITLRDEPFIKLMQQRLKDCCDLLDTETERARNMGVFTVPVSGELEEMDIPGSFPWEGTA